MPAIVRSSPNSSGCTLEAWLRACFLKRSRISRQSRRLWLTRRGRPCVLRSWTGGPGRLVNWAGTRAWPGRRRASMLTCSSPTVSSTTFGRAGTATFAWPGKTSHEWSRALAWSPARPCPLLTASARHGRMRTYVKAAPVISTSPVSSGCAWLNNWKSTSSSTRTVRSLIKVIACSYSGVCPRRCSTRAGRAWTPPNAASTSPALSARESARLCWIRNGFPAGVVPGPCVSLPPGGQRSTTRGSPSMGPNPGKWRRDLLGF